MYKKARQIIVLAALATTISLAPATYAADDSSECQTFVQKFYDWYVAKARGPVNNSPTLDKVVKARSEVFSADLCKQIKEDLAASAKSTDGVVGLDFDPVLNSQEEPEKYTVGKVQAKGNLFLVDVYSIDGGKKSKEVTVQPELSHNAGKWEFVNFHYKFGNKNEDLLDILKDLRNERASFKKPKAKH
jgi:Protein of unknown function (DUF3828)